MKRLIFTTFLFWVLVIAVQGQAPSVNVWFPNIITTQPVYDNTLKDNLVSCWEPTNGTTLDDLYASNDATINGATYSDGVLTLDGTDDYLSATRLNDLLTGYSTITFSTWFETTSTQPLSLIGSLNDGSTSCFLLMLNYRYSSANPGYIRLYVRDDDNKYAGLYTTTAYPDIYDGNLHNFVMTWNVGSNSQVNFYLDGSEIATTYTNYGTYSNFSDFTYNVYLASINNRGSYYFPFDGNILQQSLWDASLTSTQLADLWNNGELLPFANWGSSSGTPSFSEISCWGNSLTVGAGQTPYPTQLASLTGYTVNNEGVGGENSTEIKTRMLAATSQHDDFTIIWAGRNNLYDDMSTVLPDIAAMVAALSHDNYLILSILNGNYAGEESGGTYYNQIMSVNNSLASTYGSKYVDVRAELISNYNPGIPQDVIDYNNDVVPSSLRTDNIHLTTAGYTIIANYLATYID